MLHEMARRTRHAGWSRLEAAFRAGERREISRIRVLSRIPRYVDRLGGLGTRTYGEWCYTIGAFNSILFLHLPPSRPLAMLDVGCGAGRLYLAVEPMMTEDDRYVGVDIGRAQIETCRRTYHDPRAEFVFYDAPNAQYSASRREGPAEWPLGERRFNLVTALSVWTHLAQVDWIAYLGQVRDRLTEDGVAMITFFVLDDDYEASLPARSGSISRFYPEPQDKWVFDRPAYGSTEWFCPAWVPHPETAIGVTKAAFDREVAAAGLRVEAFYPGSWKEKPGLFFQDVAILRRAA